MLSSIINRTTLFKSSLKLLQRSVLLYNNNNGCHDNFGDFRELLFGCGAPQYLTHKRQTLPRKLIWPSQQNHVTG